MSYLPYISDDILKALVQEVVDCIFEAQKQEEQKLHENVIDPFSAIFDGVVQNVDLDGWLEKEKARQVQKTVQNKIGKFHQSIVGSLPGWEDLGTGKGLDVRNQSLQLIAEIKNKHNTVKGSNKYVIYDELLLELEKPEYRGYTAYYVEVIPDDKKPYNHPFTPPYKGQKRPKNEKIRRISGQAFYNLATGEIEALSMLFNILPDVIDEVAEVEKFSEERKASFRTLFDKAYGIS